MFFEVTRMMTDAYQHTETDSPVITGSKHEIHSGGTIPPKMLLPVYQIA
jgi:hypothetical protein